MSSVGLRHLGVIVVPALTNQERMSDPLWLANVATFDEPSVSATFARGQSPTLWKLANILCVEKVVSMSGVLTLSLLKTPHVDTNALGLALTKGSMSPNLTKFFYRFCNSIHMLSPGYRFPWAMAYASSIL